MLDYKDIIIKHYVLHMSGRQIAAALGVSKSGVNDFLKAFDQCEVLSFPLPTGITNYGIAELIYDRAPEGAEGRDLSYELPDFTDVEKQMGNRKNMTLVFLWGRYKNRCVAEGKKFYSYRQFCDRYVSWCEENYETLHFNAVIGQKMEVDFAGKTFPMISPLTGKSVLLLYLSLYCHITIKHTIIVHSFGNQLICQVVKLHVFAAFFIKLLKQLRRKAGGVHYFFNGFIRYVCTMATNRGQDFIKDPLFKAFSTWQF